MPRCYKYVTVINDKYVVLGRCTELSFAVHWGEDDRYFQLVFVEKRRYIRVEELLGKPCVTPEDLPEIMQILIEKGLLQG